MAEHTTPEELQKQLADERAREAFFSRLMGRVLLVVLANAQKRTPVRTGTLRRSETSRVDAGGLRGFVDTNVVYAPFVHARVPFFQHAIDDSRAAVAKLLEEEGGEYLKGLAE